MSTVDYMVRLFKNTECSLCGDIIPCGESFLERILVMNNVKVPQIRIKVCLQCSLPDIVDKQMTFYGGQQDE